MFSRYTDKRNINKNRTDFARRKYGMPILGVLATYVGAFLVMLLAQYLIAPATMGLLSVILGVIFTILAISAGLNANRYHDLIMATEFQNAIFSSAVRINSEFCLIVRNDGSLVYADNGFNNYFDATKGVHGLDALLASGGLRESDKRRLLSGLMMGMPETLPFTTTKNNLSLSVEPLPVFNAQPPKEKTIKLTLNHLKRPTGYSILKAHVNRTLVTPSINEANFDLLKTGIYSLSDEGTFSYANDACCQLFGYDRNELRQKQPEALFDNHTSLTLTRSARNKEGKTFTVIHEMLPLADRYGNLKDYYLIARLPETAAAPVPTVAMPVAASHSLAMATTTASVWDVLADSPIANILIDEHGTILKANHAFTALLECSQTEAEGSTILERINEHSKTALQRLMKEVLQGTSPAEHALPLDIQFTGDKGLTVLLYLSRFMDSSNRPQLIGHLIDTTEQKNLELRFVHSQKMQAIGQLAGGIAHDFNNLLTAMIGFCDLLLMRHPAGNQSFADIMQIKQNANRAANLVRQLLAFSRKQTLQPVVIDITGALDELSNLIGRLIGENIQLNMQHGKDLKLVKVDLGQLEQVIINLAVNARDAMEDNGALTIRTSNITISPKHPLSKELMPPAEDEVIGNGEYVLIEVIDTGCGIPKEIVSKIFEPFFSTKEIGSGTGLGLSTVYGIVKQTDGYIYVTSKKNQGTTFSIFLKSYNNNEISTDELREVDVSEKNLAVDLTGSGTILLVEDESAVRIFSTHALINKGYTVLEAESGDAALKIIHEKGNEIDVIVTDVVMPGMNGPTMIEQVIKNYPAIRVIFMSGYAEDAFIQSYGTERKFNFLPKPFTLKQLAGKVKEVIDQE